MAVTIIPSPEYRWLKVEGDVEAVLAIPAEAPEELEDGEEFVRSYFISLSEGSLIHASHGADPEFDVVVEGAGNVRVGHDGKSLSVDWRIEWVNLASSRAATALAHKSPTSLPLFDRLA